MIERAGSMTQHSDFPKSESRALSDYRNCPSRCRSDNTAMDDEYEWIRQGLKKEGKSRSGLAKALGLSASAITSLLGAIKPRALGSQSKSKTRPQKPRRLKANEVLLIARYLEVEPPSFRLPRTVPLFPGSGTVTPGRPHSELHRREVRISVSPGDEISSAALLVTGGIMADRVEGSWIFYFLEKIEAPFTGLINQLCVCKIDGANLVPAVLLESRYPGLFDLHPPFPSAAPLLAQKLEWAAGVSMMLTPLSSAELLQTVKPPDGAEILEIRKHA